MLDNEWRYLFPGTDYTFGRSRPVWNIKTPELGDVALRTADSDRPRQDGVDFGVDFYGNRTITFALGVQDPIGSSQTRDRAAQLSRVWQADWSRATPGALSELRMRYNGRERAVFGRPRRFSANYADCTKSNFVQVDADFVTADHLFYGTQDNVESITLVPEFLGGGFVSPFVFPLTTTANTDRSTGITVDSELPVWPVFTISGEITNPVLEVIGVCRIELRTSLAHDDVVTIDTRPWMRSVRLENGASIAGTLARSSTRLRKASIPPGSYELAFRGKSTSNLATASVAWRSTYSTP